MGEEEKRRKGEKEKRRKEKGTNTENRVPRTQHPDV